MKQLPIQFTEYTRRIMGEERWQKFMEGMEQPCPNSVRINKVKSEECGVRSVECGVVWCPDGYYLSERPEYTLDPLLHAGCYYVQEASSMFLDRVLRQYVNSPVRMLDMCAAPGGKTTAAMGALPEGSFVMSNEPVRQRANILAENVQKWGNPLNIVTNNYPRDYARSGLLFDVVLCDVPCSGEGMFRKDEGAISEWSVANVEKCWQLQREIVIDAWQCLKTDGILIYSTCTYNIKEDEENVRWICENLGAEMLPVDILDDWNITGSLLSGFAAPVYRFIPGISRGEGLFMAVMRKTADTDSRRMKSVKMKAEKFPHQWLCQQEDYNIYKQGDHLVAIHSSINDVYAAACKSLNIVHAGVTLGEQKGKDIIPQQSLALSTQLNIKAFPTAELSYTAAIAYLRKEAIMLDVSVPRGFVMVTFNGHPLGFVKNLGNRANNFYPQEWRIRKNM